MTMIHALEQSSGSVIIKGDAGVGKSFFCSHLTAKLKKKNYIASKPGPGGTVLSTDLSKVSLYDVYELVADANDSVLKFYDLPDSSNELDFATNHATNEIFNTIKNDVFAELKKTSVMDICNQINQKAYAD